MSSTEIPIKRPEGATHWAPETRDFNAAFAMQVDGRWKIVTVYAFDRGHCHWVAADPLDSSARYVELPALPEPAPWINYAEQRPKVAGAYRWRLESVVEPGMFVTFVAHMRERGAGHQNVISPLFDYWDGYRVHVPAGLHWQALRPEDPQDVEWCRVAGVEVEGLSPLPCPYCNKVPKWDALLRYDGGGVGLTDPHKFNNWKLACCAWGSSPAYKSPIELVKRRDAVLSRLRPAPAVTP